MEIIINYRRPKVVFDNTLSKKSSEEQKKGFRLLGLQTEKCHDFAKNLHQKVNANKLFCARVGKTFNIRANLEIVVYIGGVPQ